MTRVAPVLFALSSLFACNGVFDLDPFPRGDTTGLGPVFDYASPECGDCVSSRCADEQDACRRDDACHATNACISLCELDDVVCRDACLQNPLTGGDALHVALDSCRREQCLSTCLGDGGLAPFDGDDACRECVDDVCADRAAECIAHPGCEALVACWNSPACDDPECVLRCAYEASPWSIDDEIEALADDLRACWGDCAACDVGSALACGGEFTWGQADEERLTIDIGVRAVKGFAVPATGVTVVACAAFDIDCAQEQDRTTVDADGRAVLSVPTLATGWNGFLMFSGDMPEPIGTPVFPTRFYFGRPLVRDDRLTDTVVVDADTLDLIAGLVGTSAMSDKAHVAIGAADCLFFLGRGVRFDAEGASADTVAYFSQDDLFVADDGGMVTDGSGTGGFFNLEPSTSPRTVRMFDPAADDRPVGKYQVLLSPGVLTAIHAVPSPDP